MIGMAWPFEAGWIDQSFQIWESFLLLPQSTKVPPRSQSIKIHQGPTRDPSPPRSTKDQSCSQRALDRLSGLRSRTMSLVRNSIRILLFSSTFCASASLESSFPSSSLPPLPDSPRFPPKNMSTPLVGPNRQARRFVNFFQIPGNYHHPQPPM